MDVPIRLAVVSADGLYRDLLAAALATLPGLQVLGVLASADDALAAIGQLRADVAVLDDPLPGPLDGTQLGLTLRQRRPGLGIVLLSDRAHPTDVAALAPEDRAGWAHLGKSAVGDLQTLHRAIRGAAEHLLLVDTEALPGPATALPEAIAQLSPRDRQLLALIAQGFSNSAIARQFHLAEKTVENQVSLLYQRLGLQRGHSDLHPRVGAALLYLRGGEAAGGR